MRMQAQLAALQKDMDDERAEKATKPKKPNKVKTPPATHPGPSPASAAKAPPRKDVKGRPEPEASESEDLEGLSQAAKLQRLRRLCEMKPSGTCRVPEAIHKRWAAKGHSRQELLDALEEANFDEDNKCPNLLVLFCLYLK